MPFKSLLIASPAKFAAAAFGAGVLGLGGYAVYRTAAPHPLPLLPAAEAYRFSPAPPVEELPFAAPAPIGYLEDPGVGYAWAERAYAVNYAVQGLPPDYGYAYDDTEVWVWETAGWILDVEPLSTGARYYYYAPGYDEPYFIWDDGYGYGFDRGMLVLVIDRSGELMPREFVRARSDWAGRYLWRARDVREARRRAQREDARWRIDSERWQRRQARISAHQARFEQAAMTQAAWTAYRQETGARELDFFAAERRRRLDDAAPLFRAPAERARRNDLTIARAADVAATRAYVRDEAGRERREARAPRDARPRLDARPEGRGRAQAVDQRDRLRDADRSSVVRRAERPRENRLDLRRERPRAAREDRDQRAARPALRERMERTDRADRPARRATTERAERSARSAATARVERPRLDRPRADRPARVERPRIDRRQADRTRPDRPRREARDRPRPDRGGRD